MIAIQSSTPMAFHELSTKQVVAESKHVRGMAGALPFGNHQRLFTTHS